MGGNMGVIKSIFKPRDKPKNHTGDSIGGGRSFPFGRTWSGKSVTERIGYADNGSICVCSYHIGNGSKSADSSL